MINLKNISGKIAKKVLALSLTLSMVIGMVPASFADLAPLAGPIPTDIYVPIGEQVVFELSEESSLDASSIDGSIAGASLRVTYDTVTSDESAPSAGFEDGHYYRIKNLDYGYVSSILNTAEGTLTLVASAGTTDSTIWKAEETSSGFVLKSLSGSLEFISGNRVALGNTGSTITLEPTTGGYDGGFLVCSGGQVFNLYGDRSLLHTYANEHLSLGHTSFFIHEVTDRTGAVSTFTFSGKATGNTSVMIGGVRHNIHVYNPAENLVVLSEPDQQVTVTGYNLSDVSPEDRGSYSYNCTPAANKITFTAASDPAAFSAETITIGSLEYRVIVCAAAGSQLDSGEAGSVELTLPFDTTIDIPLLGDESRTAVTASNNVASAAIDNSAKKITFTGLKVGTTELTLGLLTYDITVTGEQNLVPAGGSIDIEIPGVSSLSDLTVTPSDNLSVSVPATGKVRVSNDGVHIPALGGETVVTITVNATGRHYDTKISVSPDLVAIPDGGKKSIDYTGKLTTDFTVADSSVASFSVVNEKDVHGKAYRVNSISEIEDGDYIVFGPNSYSSDLVYAGSNPDGIPYSRLCSIDAEAGIVSNLVPEVIWKITVSGSSYRLQNIATGEFIYADSMPNGSLAPLKLATSVPAGAYADFTMSSSAPFELSIADGVGTGRITRQNGGYIALTDGRASKLNFYEVLPTDVLYLNAVSAGTTYFFDGDTNHKVKVSGLEAVYGDREFTDLSLAIKAAKDAPGNPRISAKTVKLLSGSIDYSGTLPLGVLLDLNGQYEDFTGPMLTFEAKSPSSSKTEVIYPRIKDDDQYLFLPAYADWSGIKLNLPKGAVISFEGRPETIELAANNEAIDFTVLGDLSVPGTKVNATVTYTSGGLTIVQKVIIMKSEGIATLFVDVDTAEAGNPDDIMAWLNVNKKHESTIGTALLISGDGSRAEYDNTIASFHMRGNSEIGSASRKPGYALKISSKTALAGDVVAKSWVLVGNNVSYRDTTTFANSIGYTLYQQVNTVAEGAQYGVQYRPVDLYINGEYRGTYMLQDKINDDRVNITSSKYEDFASVEAEEELTVIHDDPSDPALAAGIQWYKYSTNAKIKKSKAGGFIFEISNSDPEDSGFVTRHGVRIEIKEPGTPTKAQVQSLAILYQEFEDALYGENGYNDKGKYYGDYIDIPSWARMYLVKGFLRDIDFFQGSNYFTIDCGNQDGVFTTKIYSCTAWDFDGSYTVINGRGKELFHTEFHIDEKYRLVQFGDFVDSIRSQNSEMIYTVNGEAKNFTDLVRDMCEDGGFVDEYYDLIAGSLAQNAVIWDPGSWAPDLATRIKSNLSNHIGLWDEMWAEDSLQGLTVELVNDPSGASSLVATATGATKVSWFKSGSNTPVKTETLAESIEAGNPSGTFTFAPDEIGIYYAKAYSTTPLAGTETTELVSERLVYAPAFTIVFNLDQTTSDEALIGVYNSRGRQLNLFDGTVTDTLVWVTLDKETYNNVKLARLFFLNAGDGSYAPRKAAQEKTID